MDERREITYNKARLRVELLKIRAHLPDRDERAECAAARILPLLCGNVLIYISIGSELPTISLADKLLNSNGVCVFAPFTVDGVIYPRKICHVGVADKYGNMAGSCYSSGIRESGNFDIDVCVTPLVGFNDKGFRIGYGKGCYDRYFAAHPHINKIGLAFDCQAADFRPEKHDVALDSCVTETKVIKF